MNPELLIRPSLRDHKTLGDLLAPARPGAARPLSRLVLSAQDAARNPQLRELAVKSGTPVLIDPMTLLFQGPVAADDPWVKDVSFGRADAYTAERLANPFVLDTIVAGSLEFQVEQGATAIIPPYFYAERPESPWFDASLAAIARTAKRMRAQGVSLPLVPILCAQLRGFTHRPDWQAGLDRFAAAAIDVGPQALGLFLSPVGKGDESYSKVLDPTQSARAPGNYASWVRSPTPDGAYTTSRAMPPAPTCSPRRPTSSWAPPGSPIRSTPRATPPSSRRRSSCGPAARPEPGTRPELAFGLAYAPPRWTIRWAPSALSCARTATGCSGRSTMRRTSFRR